MIAPVQSLNNPTITSRIGVGSVQFGTNYGISNTVGQVDRREVGAILSTASAAGIRTIDTAASYGSAEEVLEQTLPRAHQFSIVTKTLPLRHGLAEVEHRARRSWEYFGRKSVEAILVHAATDMAGAEGHRLWDMLMKLRQEGLFNRIGISAYYADRPLELAQKYRPDIMQIPLSILDQRLIQTEQLTALKQLGIEIHARSIFLQGLLLMDPTRLPTSLSHSATALMRVRDKIQAAGSTVLAASIGFVLSQEAIDVAIVGVTSRNELLQILDATEQNAVCIDWAACALDDELTLTPSRW